MNIIILAGGFATRLWPLTEKRAKPLLLLDGKTILAHKLKKVSPEDRVIISTNSIFYKDFEKEIKKFPDLNIEIFCEDAHSDQNKPGALSAVALVLDHFKITDSVIILAGDNLVPDLDLKTIYPKSNQAILTTFQVENLHEAQRFGVIKLGEKIGAHHHVLHFQEKPQNPESKYVSTAFFGIGKHLLGYVASQAKKTPDALGAVFEILLEKKAEVLAIEVDSWFDVGDYDTYLEAHKALQKDSFKHANIKADTNRIEGKVYAGSGCEIKNCTIVDSIIYPNTKLKNCYISRSVIDEGCELSGVDINRKLIRRGTRLNNFV